MVVSCQWHFTRCSHGQVSSHQLGSGFISSVRLGLLNGSICYLARPNQLFGSTVVLCRWKANRHCTLGSVYNNSHENGVLLSFAKTVGVYLANNDYRSASNLSVIPVFKTINV